MPCTDREAYFPCGRAFIFIYVCSAPALLFCSHADSHPSARDTLGTGIYFTTYEAIKHQMAKLHGGEPTDPVPSAVAGVVTGAVSWIFVSIHPYPVSVDQTH